MIECMLRMIIRKSSESQPSARNRAQSFLLLSFPNSPVLQASGKITVEEVQDSSSGSEASSPTQTFTAPKWHSKPSRKPTLESSTSAPTIRAAPRRTLKETTADLFALFRILSIFIPAYLRYLGFLIPRPFVNLGTAVANQVASSLHKRDILASNLLYDLLVIPWRMVVSIFFREIESRGAWKCPKEGEGAVIYVAGPHSNQFVDGIVLMSEIRSHVGRRCAFIMAKKSMDEPFIGGCAKLMQAIPVVRPQDLAKKGAGKITLSPDDPLLVIGIDTSFIEEFTPKTHILLAKAEGGGTGDIAEVLDDTHLRLLKPFSEASAKALLRNATGAPYKILPHVDQTTMYQAVFERLASGGSLCIFPEGGSHDRTDLLPLKAGVSIMALGALSRNPDLKLRIVPVGLSYFHADKFRSRAVVEFGNPIEITKEEVAQWNAGGAGKKEVVAGMMDTIVQGLRSVTVRAPDYETLMLIQATRRLYRPPGEHLTLGQTVSLTRRFTAGYEVYKDAPPVKHLQKRVAEYNTLLRHMGLKDHQIKGKPRPWSQSLILLLWRFFILSVWSVFALPGVILNAPIFIACKIISKRKAREALAGSSVKLKGNDIIATWKILVAIGGAPALYTIYSIGAIFLAIELDLPLAYKIVAPIATWAGLPLIGYSALKFGEVGMDLYKSLRPLFLSLLPNDSKQLEDLRRMRINLRHEISDVVDEFGPKLFDDFQASRRPSTAREAADRPPQETDAENALGRRGVVSKIFGYLDSLVFGQSKGAYMPVGSGANEGSDAADATSDSEGPEGLVEGSEGMVGGRNSLDGPDYDEVVHLLPTEPTSK
ncbi:hypothetical protein P7C70_g2342, partial [Phenoliferia sp. Uapishka_3]